MSPANNEKKIHANPSKDFFVTMITRDISLSDCIFDLLDNSIDGARRLVQERGGQNGNLDGFCAKIEFGIDHFSITDNCGGITLSDAIDYAFHFGRRRDAPVDVSRGIGLYGIGMKRAIFKIGRSAIIESETAADSFSVMVNVDEWEKVDNDWDFDYQEKDRSGQEGTTVRIKQLHPGIANAFNDPTFRNALAMAVARDYSFFISSGFEIQVGGMKVPSYSYELREGGELTPASLNFEDDGVNVRIVAGLVDDLPDEIPSELRPDKVDRYGWFVVCNDRVVLAADKTERTIWGVDGYKVWHPQYNGFAGFVFFSCDDPKKLPWTTTKREVDTADPLYRRTVGRMKEITDEFISYTNRRKADVESAKAAEQGNKSIRVAELTVPKTMAFPKLVSEENKGKAEIVTISYQKPRSEVDEIKDSCGNWNMSAKDVGRITFEYYRKMELGK